MNVFAGFWVDGAVRQPEDKHFDCNGWVVANWKDKNLDLDICRKNFDKWSEVYWLDTSPRESLTPEELYSVLKVVWVGVGKVCKNSDYSWYVDEIADGVKVDWGNLTQYPPPIEPQWLRVTRENVGQYLFRDCRTQKNDITYAGRIVGWCIEDDCCLVESDYKTEEPILQWDVVEVQNAPTP